MKFYKSMFMAAFIFSSATSIWAASPVEAAVKEELLQENVLDQFNVIRKMAAEEISTLKNPLVPRKVKKDRQPKIVLTQNKIYFNESEMKMGGSISSWKKIIAGNPRCITSSIIFCIWDDLGLEVGTDSKINQHVRFVNLHLNFSEEDESLARVTTKSSEEAGLKYSPRQVFSGYLEIDGFGIDSNTKFWELRAGANSKNKMHCGLRDCSHPSGPFGPHVNIYLTLDGPRETDKVLELGLSSSD
jgi:hypothetical protein